MPNLTSSTQDPNTTPWTEKILESPICKTPHLDMWILHLNSHRAGSSLVGARERPLLATTEVRTLLPKADSPNVHPVAVP